MPTELALSWVSELEHVARANGPVSEMEDRMLRAIAQALGVSSPTGLAVDDARLAASCNSEGAGRSLLQLALLVALSDRKLGSEAYATIQRLRRIVRADDPFVKLLRPLYAGFLRPVTVAVRARQLRPVLMQAPSRAGFVWGVARKILGARGGDTQLAWKYRRLGLLQEGTFGRLLWKTIRRQGIDFPGEAYGLPEPAFPHDCSHVLGDYDTSPLGELMHAWFIAGYRREDPFVPGLSAVLQYYHGVPVVPFSTVRCDLLEPERIVRHYLRGRLVRRDLSDGMSQHWPLMPRPIEDVRVELGIVPRSDREAAIEP
jgi:hypothetical protein